MDVVPAFLIVDEVKFPLVVDGGRVRVADDPRFPGLNALSYVAGHLIARTGSARIAELAQRQSLQHQAFTAFFIGPDDRDDLGDGVVNWTRLAGRPPDLDDAYFVSTTWIPQALVLPRHTLIRLVEQVGALEDAVAAHQLEARITGVTEAGPVHPDPALEDEAPGNDGGDAGGDRNGDPESAATASYPRVAPTRIAADDTLRDVETLAAQVDALDAAARQGERLYADVERSAAAAARRRRLLLELEVAGLLEPALAGEARVALSRLGVSRTLGYHDAAQALARYLASPERAARFPGEPVPSVTEARVSLDWFRTPSGHRPDGVTEHEWLALCERNFASALPSSSAGERFVRLCGGMHQLLYRAEVGPAPCLWRALRAWMTTSGRVALRMGNPSAPGSPWGRDELDVFGDGRVQYRNQRGAIARSATAQLVPAAAEKLFAAIAASPFPVWTDTRPLLPGSTLVELTVERPAGAATARFDYHTALKTPGYDAVLRLLTGWAGVLRTPPDKRAASAELTQIVDLPS